VIAAASIPSEDDLIVGIAKQFDCPQAVALSWLIQTFIHFNPRQASERLAQREALNYEQKPEVAPATQTQVPAHQAALGET
jgi:hypothetical protein